MKTAIILSIGLLLAGCSKKKSSSDIVYSKNGYDLVLVGGDPASHVPGNLQLWQNIGGKQVPVWTYVVNDPLFCGGTVIFDGGLSDESKWKGYPALLLFTPSSGVIEISEPVTFKACREQKLDYSIASNSYSYLLLDPSTNGGVHLTGQRLPSAPNSLPQVINVTIQCADFDNWKSCIFTNSPVKSYGNIDAHIAAGSACLDAGKP